MSRRNQKTTLGILFAAGLLAGLMGCQDSTRKPVQAHPVQIAPPPVQESLPQISLPLNARRRPPTPLMVFPPNGIDWLVAQSRTAFDAGEQDFRAGRLGKAREEFDDALDQLLASGFEIRCPHLDLMNLFCDHRFTEQTRIVAEVERRLSVVEELESVVTANLQRATRLRQSILQKAFRGELCG